MQTFKLPTLDRLNATIPPELDANKVAANWMASFATSAEAGDAAGTAALFDEDSHWRDMLVLTWDFRTFHGAPAIGKFLTDRLASAKLAKFQVKEQALQQLTPDLAWICIVFNFETHVGPAAGIVRLVPQSSGAWKAHCMYTNLEGLNEFPEKIENLRNPVPNFGNWEQERQQALEFVNENPVVLIIGAGHSGLDLAARLKCLGVRTLVVEKNPRIGDNWRNRYDALCLHDPVWYDHMPYLPFVLAVAALLLNQSIDTALFSFPSSWPIYTPAKKVNVQLNIDYSTAHHCLLYIVRQLARTLRRGAGIGCVDVLHCDKRAPQYLWALGRRHRP
jgi:hypothetical protein